VHAVGHGGDLLDTQRHWQDAYGLSPGEWVLVRPDGYVGAIVASDRPEALAAYLQRAGIELKARAHG
jgi:hypothetical protein